MDVQELKALTEAANAATGAVEALQQALTDLGDPVQGLEAITEAAHEAMEAVTAVQDATKA